MLSLGTYPDISLSIARKRRDEARECVASGRDPSAVRTAHKQALAHTFEAVAREWYAVHASTWAASHSVKVISRLEKDVFPRLGPRPIGGIDAPDLLDCLRRVERRGAIDTARRIRQYCGGIFRYAIATARATRDVAADLRDAISTPIGDHYPNITSPARLGELLRAIDGYRGTNAVRAALALTPHLFVRPGELRAARWNEFDLDGGLWTIPPERRKLKSIQKLRAEPHLVPLSQQAIEILRDLRPAKIGDSYVFPNETKPHAAMSDGAINKALRLLGFGGEIVAHGFRHTASTMLHEQGFETEWIERQLSHSDSNTIRGVYNRAKHLTSRRKMMQLWSDYLDTLKRTAAIDPNAHAIRDMPANDVRHVRPGQGAHVQPRRVARARTS